LGRERGREGYVRLRPASLQDEVNVLIGNVVILGAESHVRKGGREGGEQGGREGYVRLLPASLQDEVNVLIGNVVILGAENHISTKTEGLQQLVLRHLVLGGQPAWREGGRQGGREG